MKYIINNYEKQGWSPLGWRSSAGKMEEFLP